MLDFSGLTGAVNFGDVVIVLFAVASAIAAVLVTIRGVDFVFDAINSWSKPRSSGDPFSDPRSAEYRAYRRSSTYRQKNGASYARWARRNNQW